MEKKSLFLAPTYGRAVSDMLYASQIVQFSIFGENSLDFRVKFNDLMNQVVDFLANMEKEAHQYSGQSVNDNKEV